MVRNFFWNLCSTPFKGIRVKTKQNKTKPKKDYNRKRNCNLFHDVKTLNILPTRYIRIKMQTKEIENESLIGKKGTVNYSPLAWKKKDTFLLFL